MDIQAAFNNDSGTADWVLANNDVAPAYSDLLSSVLQMLFSDARCSDDFTPPDGDPRGWWGNDFEPYQIGSRLWQLNRAYFSGKNDIVLQARDYTNEAMQVFVKQGIVGKVNVNAVKAGQNGISISIQMFKPKSTSSVTFNFNLVWDQIKNNPTASSQATPQIIVNSILDEGFYLDVSRLG